MTTAALLSMLSHIGGLTEVILTITALSRKQKLISRHLAVASKDLCGKQGRQFFRGVARSRLGDGQSATGSPACCQFMGCVLQLGA